MIAFEEPATWKVFVAVSKIRETRCSVRIGWFAFSKWRAIAMSCADDDCEENRVERIEREEDGREDGFDDILLDVAAMAKYFLIVGVNGPTNLD